MEEQLNQVVSSPAPAGAAEERMLRADLVREIVARAQRGDGAKRITRELGVDRKTVKRWLRLGAWQPRQYQRRPRQSTCSSNSSSSADRRWAGTAWCCSGNWRGLVSPAAISRSSAFSSPIGRGASGRSWPRCGLRPSRANRPRSTMGNCGCGLVNRRRPSIYSCSHSVISRRLFTRGYHNERLATLLDGHERALRHFSGVPLNCLYDNPRNLVLGRSESKVLWHPVFEDFAR